MKWIVHVLRGESDDLQRLRQQKEASRADRIRAEKMSGLNPDQALAESEAWASVVGSVAKAVGDSVGDKERAS